MGIKKKKWMRGKIICALGLLTLNMVVLSGCGKKAPLKVPAGEKNEYIAQYPTH